MLAVLVRHLGSPGAQEMLSAPSDPCKLTNRPHDAMLHHATTACTVSALLVLRWPCGCRHIQTLAGSA